MSTLEKITIRRPTVDDLRIMSKLLDDAIESSSTEDIVQQRLERWSTGFEKDSSYLFYVAENEKKNIVGWCSGRKTLEHSRIVNNQIYDCEVGTICVQQEYQYRGIGRELWKIIWNEILERFHPENFIVWGVDREHTHQFYRSLGGTPMGTKMADDMLMTAYVWNDLKPYDSTSFVIFK
ncbi:unnamed protein product [Adineta steineri]|uniref:N-acetyltransferase domain-containing protein n=1 Tax=Adineta steineri TaxID=433720 RepID=A0A815E8U5_9BILA|nr:unnamed protein product [Adineta steineri]CAF4126783.1 unnamed protein product [Adineta steineri]